MTASPRDPGLSPSNRDQNLFPAEMNGWRLISISSSNFRTGYFIVGKCFRQFDISEDIPKLTVVPDEQNEGVPLVVFWNSLPDDNERTEELTLSRQSGLYDHLNRSSTDDTPPDITDTRRCRSASILSNHRLSLQATRNGREGDEQHNSSVESTQTTNTLTSTLSSQLSPHSSLAPLQSHISSQYYPPPSTPSASPTRLNISVIVTRLLSAALTSLLQTYIDHPTAQREAIPLHSLHSFSAMVHHLSQIVEAKTAS
ncbi:hypothetical protein BLNAU_23678 [Blattamonas nauphoetae]|uniref:Uncharacterized protein n=1 Tax=Blattamonas nauphoetae TaxID=2049346 RepID=A0ABQ9WTQ0_9EUKA|nr:hypothetical protein BLNAU_23678 [Blattamonas nauphoetae]